MLPCCCQARSTNSFKTQSVEKKGIVITLRSQQRTNSYLTFWLLIILLSLLIACDGKEYRKDLLPGSVFCFPDTPGNLKGPRSYRDCPRGTLKLTYTESIPQLHGLTCILTCFYILPPSIEFSRQSTFISFGSYFKISKSLSFLE